MRGFSLIEMVAAFLVFAIAMGVLMQILAGSIANTRRSADYTMAALWAQSKLDTVGVGEPIEAGHSDGEFDDTYRWDLEITQVDPLTVEPAEQPTMMASTRMSASQVEAQQMQSGRRVDTANAGLGGGIEDAPFDLYQIDLTVSWGGRFGGNRRSATFSTLRAVNPDPNRVGMVGADQAGLSRGARHAGGRR